MRPFHLIRGAICLAALVAAASTDLRAQDPPAAAPRLTVGPLTITPRLELHDIGIDENVFNDPENPQRDFTATITPRVAGEARLGPVRATFGSFLSVVYFREFESERSLNRGAEGRIELAEGLLRPYVSGGILDTHERPNPEIDLRAGRRQHTYGAGLGLALTSRTILGFNLRRTTVEFDEDAVFRGVALDRTLGSRIEAYDVALKLQLTPLTAWTITAGVQQDVFDAAPERNADSVTFGTALEFSPSALITGRAGVGYRRFTPVNDQLAAFEGIVSQVGVTYAVESTRLEGAFERDVRYSYEELQPYYVTLNGRLVMTQRVAGPFDLQGIVGRTRMNYRELGAGDEFVRTDTQLTYGGGMGMRLGDTARLGFNAEWSRRRSDNLDDRRYDKRRFYGSLTYGL
jgi:hypothetical protein